MCLNKLSLHSSLCPGQLQSLVCVKKYVKVCTGVVVTQTYIWLRVGKFKRSIQKVPPVFEKEQGEQNSFSLQEQSCKVHVKCVFLSALLSK